MAGAPTRAADPPSAAPAPPALPRVTRAVRAVSRLSGAVAAGLIAAAVLVVCQMVFARYVLGQSTVWQTDFTTYCLIAATFVGSPYVLLTRGHVNVDVLPQYLAPAARFRLALFAQAVTVAFAATLAVLGFLFWKEAFDKNWVSDTMWRARLWIPYASMPIGLGLLTLQAISDFADLVAGREAPFGLGGARR